MGIDEKKKKEEDTKEISRVAVVGAQVEITQRYGAAIKEHLVAYEGVDNETGEILSKSLKSISMYHTSESNYEQNIEQQAGFSAELKTSARENAEKIINGENNNRSTRTDDIKKQPDGKGGTVGGTNDQQYDIAEVDKNGFFVEGSGRQLKYVGKSPDDCAKKLLSKDYDKYRDNDTAIEIPKDYYDEVQKILSEEENKVKEQIKKALEKGNTEQANKLQERLKRIEKTRKNLKKGKLTKKESIEARKNPQMSTAKDVVRISHKAGIEGAKSGALIGGSISLIRNVVEMVKGEEDFEEAAINVIEDTGKSAVTGYITSFAGSTIKGVMQNAKTATLRNLSGTNVPSMIVSATVSMGKTMSQYFRGEIDGTDCLENLGQNGVNTISTTIFGVLGEIVLPIGGVFIGSMVGYALASASYGALIEVQKEAKLAYEERIRIEKECEEQIHLIKKYRTEMEELISEYLQTHIETFNQAFLGIKDALEIGDVDGVIAGANSITKKLGKEAQFNSMDEFEILMNSPVAFKI